MLAAEAAEADDDLNEQYQSLIGKIPEEAEELRQVQRAWLKFREAECSFKQYFMDGIAGPPQAAYMTCYADITRERARALSEIERNLVKEQADQ